MTNKDQFEGAANDVVGKVQQAAGVFTEDDELKAEGRAREVGGKVQGAYGDVVEGVRDYAERKPFGALAIGVGLGVVVGLLLGRGRD